MKKLLVCLVICWWMSAFPAFAVEPPHRIVSLAPYLTEEMFLLNADEALVGVTSYCIRPPQAQRKVIVGTVVDFNLEQVVALEPDMVFATPLTDLRGIARLERMGIPVQRFSALSDFGGICAQMLEVGTLVGRPEAAQELVAQARLRMQAVERRVAGLKKRKVFIQVGSNPLFTMNREYFIHDLIERCGGINIAADASGGVYSREMVLAADPDCIIIATMGIVGGKEQEAWQRYRSLSAVQHHKIFIMDSNLVCSPTPLTFVACCEQVSRWLHEDAPDE